MKTNLRVLAVLAVPMALGTGGCAMFRASNQDVDVNSVQHFGANYDYADMRNVTQVLADQMLAEFLSKQPAPPIMMVAGVENRTEQHIDTKNITDRIRDLIFQTGKARFVNEERRQDLLKEQGYEAANATPETAARVGVQLGARYMISGSFTEMQETSPHEVRVSKEKLNYYKFTLEVTDLQTGLLAWTREKEFAREASQPLIGW